jgi:two-component system invasion response regulator UvrY
MLARSSKDFVIEEAAGGREALERVRTGSWDLVLLDLVLPDVSGFEVLSELKSNRPEVPVLVFSMHTDEPYVIRALKDGASGYVTKDCPPDELIMAVRKVASGGHYIMPALAELLVGRLRTPQDLPLHELLSSREYEVMLLLARGTSLREMASHLCVSESSVSTYRTRILKKLHLENNSQITRYVLNKSLE